MRVLEPKRRLYRKKLFAKTNRGEFLPGKCPFCDSKVIARQLCRSFAFKYWLVVANLNPYMDGNLMLIPKRHVEQIEELTQDEQLEWHAAIREMKETLGELFDAASFNLSINLGECSGGSIQHLHWQIIPRPYNYKLNSINIFEEIFVVGLSATDLVTMVDRYRLKKKPKRRGA